MIVRTSEPDRERIPGAARVGRMKADQTAIPLLRKCRVPSEHRHERLAVGRDRDPRVCAPRHGELVLRPRATRIAGYERGTGLLVLSLSLIHISEPTRLLSIS